MKRLCLLIIFLLTLVSGCGFGGGPHSSIAPGTQAALLIIDKEQQSIPIWEWKEMQRVEAWMRKDLLARLRDNGIFAISLTDINEYKSPLGTLLIVNISEFYGGNFAGRPRRHPATGNATLEIDYKILDERGALLASWQDRAISVKDGTNCAEAMNRRFMERLLSVLSSKQT